jgi:hypothetical protein
MKNIVITEKQLSKIINNIQPKINEEHKEGSYMAKQQLFMIATLAHKMWEIMEEGEQLEDWMESKIAQCDSAMTSVVKAYMYDEISDKQKGMNGLDYDDLLIGT